MAFKKFFVIHKSTVALCLRLCLFFRTFYRKYAYSCYAYKKKLVKSIPVTVSEQSVNLYGKWINLKELELKVILDVVQKKVFQKEKTPQ